MTTKHRRWTVRRGKLPRKTDVDWIVYDAGGDIRAAFLTHALAVTYADKMARTVEVTLPRRVGDGGHVLGAQNLRVGVAYYAGKKTIWVEDQSLSMVDVRQNELKPLALALLAFHYGSQP
ncbi:hypothetical protein ACKFRT_04390 [Corynebacterium sp. YSMAA1_1_F7]|uniref:hypothetical protein n=1 Tax=Corynebacterium sp. YSMAA1_1_F7 TaxID=3383590 RepID=UPI0038CFD4EB